MKTALSPAFDERDAARLALRCLDLTSLRDDDSDASIRALAARADTPHGAPAALCVYPRFVATAKQALAERGLAAVRVATVVNFPHGDDAPADVARQIAAALGDGADEIDAVLPWRALQRGDEASAIALVAACRAACGGGVLLKVILETGELREPAVIRRASEIAIDGGADFIKTSTGKVAVNATPESVAVMVAVIAERGGRVGLKVAGGVSSIDDVKRYFGLACAAGGRERLDPRYLRFGASGLLPVLLAAIAGGMVTGAGVDY